MSLRIRLSRGGSKKRPFYKVVVADSRSARDGRFVERIGFHNPMLPQDHSERLKIDAERAKYWLSVGAQPSERVARFLSQMGLVAAPVRHEQSKQHLPKAKAQERARERAEAAAKASEEAANAGASASE